MHTFVLAFIKGFIFGATLAAIPGPIFFLTVQRTLIDGTLIGIACGLGAVTVDMIYAFIAAIGLSVATQALVAYQKHLTLLGSALVMYLGISILRAPLSTRTITQHTRGTFSTWLSTVFLTFANPITILSYAVFFASLGVGEEAQQSLAALAALVGGVTLGALTIILTLVGFLSVFRRQLSPQALITINVLSGLVLLAFGVAAFIQGMR